MPKIVINEIDLTTASYQPSATDVAYVPGLSVKEDAPIDLVLCSSISDFESIFGTCPFMFKDDATLIPKIKLADEDKAEFVSGTGFNTYKKWCEDNKTTYSQKFIYNGTEWRCGKFHIEDIESELGISISGTPVVEQIAKTLKPVSGYPVDGIKFADIESTLGYKVYSGEDGEYALVETEHTRPPQAKGNGETWGDTYAGYYGCTFSALSEKPDWEANKYYSCSENGKTYSLTTVEPDDWDEGYSNYYTAIITDLSVRVAPRFDTNKHFAADGKPLKKQPTDWEENYSHYKTFNPQEFDSSIVYTYDAVNDRYISVTEEPADWGTTYFTYFEKVDNIPPVYTAGDTLTVIMSYDMSYVYAKELIASGIPVMYQVVTSRDEEGNPVRITTKQEVFDVLCGNGNDIYTYESTEGMMDKGEYSFKYLTSGAYPSFDYKYYPNGKGLGKEKSYYFFGDDTSKDVANIYNFTQKMLNVAATRGDCVAIIDGTREACGAFTGSDIGEVPETSDKTDGRHYGSLSDAGSIWGAAKKYCDTAENLEYGTMFSPWATYTALASYYYTVGSVSVPIKDFGTITMPPSFGYLLALAKSIRNNPNWFTVAGIARGQVPHIVDLETSRILSNTIANNYQIRNGETSINAITNIKPYGLTIWGNRTMKNNEDEAQGGEDGLVATSFLNIRNLVSEVKKTVYNAAKTLMFEQDSSILWINFMAKVTPLLDRMRNGQGLSNYSIIKEPTDEKAKIKATIRLYPLYAVEDFEITIELRDEEVSVS